MRFWKKNDRRRGQGLVEYALIVCGVALICAAAVSILGHKTSDLIGAMAMILPGAHSDDNGSIVSGKLINTTAAGDPTTGASGAALDVVKIAGQNGEDRLDLALGGTGNTGGPSSDGVGNLVIERPDK